MVILVTAYQLRIYLIQAIGQDPRPHRWVYEVSAAIWPQPYPGPRGEVNWDLMRWAAIARLPSDCQAAIWDAVESAKAKYRLRSM